MSDPISKVKNSSGTLDAYIASADVADSFNGYAGMKRKMDVLSDGTYPRFVPLDLAKTVHKGVLPYDSGGSVELLEFTGYFTIEYDVTDYAGYFLVLFGEHIFGNSAFVVVDASGLILAKDSVTDNSGITPVREEVEVPSNAVKVYCGYDALGIADRVDDVAEITVGVGYYDGGVRYGQGDGLFCNAIDPDGFICNHFIVNGTVGKSVFRSLAQSYSHCVAYKHVTKGTVVRENNLIAFGVACGIAFVDENLSLVRVATIPDAESDKATLGNSTYVATTDGYVLWNYSSPDVLGMMSTDVGVPPFSALYADYDDFDVRLMDHTGVTWDSTREGYYGFFQSEDQFKDYEGIKVSEHIPCDKRVTMWLRGHWWAECPVAVVFDADGRKLMQWPQAKQFDNGGNQLNTGYIDTPLVFPEDASYMVLQDVSGASGVPSGTEPPELFWYYGLRYSKGGSDIPVTDNLLAGKKYVACGDSFTAANNLGSDHYDSDLGCYESYAYILAKRNGMVYAPDAISGSTMTVTESEYERYPFSQDRYKNIPEDADYITLMFGLNETTAPLGTAGSTDNTTVWGAWDVVLEWILTNRPKARVGIIIPDAWMTQSYAETLIEIANYWGIPYLDLGGDPSIPLMNGGRRSGSGATCSEKAADLRNRQHYQTYPSDAHPNYEGHVWRSTVIENWMRGL